ncbi:leader peptidase (prepilin peptidase)/N-methyltransferase [Silvibacterium bohemicum]|uniref:Prepilin leader peptidase/N-methyltransferase n=1 Tax=Silvibacterium bohemicum TaxID=1577686 RepID=A0A841K0X7_9BACT|nr:A24 family peptidase [Silvibacterium bohemicum]MBB6143894.1 leader peptidase (prepilin peptidase)/N-methyltransferase [Silvibacterium bohemicum]
MIQAWNRQHGNSSTAIPESHPRTRPPRILPPVLVLNLLIGIFVALLGLAFGSFLNVCIARLPRHESIVHPPSHCPRCGRSIQPRDNIPLLSYALLRGRCRSCGDTISWRYPAVELATALLWLLCFFAFGATPAAVAMAILCFLVLGLAVMDAETMLLPDAFTLPGIFLGILWEAAGTVNGWPDRLHAAGMSLLWAAAAAGLILLIRTVYWLVRRREGMGLGDAKFFAMLAAWLGAADALLILFLAVILGAFYGIVRMRRGRGTAGNIRVPLGAFLGVAAIYAIFAGPQTINWYLKFFP